MTPLLDPPHSSVAGRGRKNMRDGKSSRRTMILTYLQCKAAKDSTTAERWQ
jgi:hypothetical protein